MSIDWIGRAKALRPRSLRARLAAWAALLALLSTGLPGMWLTWRSYRALRNEAYASQLVLARSLASEISAVLGQGIASVNALAASPHLSRDPLRLPARLALLANAADAIDDLMVCEGNGAQRGRAHFDEAPPPFPIGERSALALAAKENKGQAVSQIHRESNGDLVLRLARWLGQDEAVLVQMRLEAHGLGSLEDLRIGQSGFAYLADEHGKPLVLPSLARRFSSAQQAALSFKFDGTEICRAEAGSPGGDLLAAVPLDPLGWAVAVRRPLDEAEAPARRMRRELILFTLLALLSSGLLAVLAARPLISGLESLARSARGIESGRPLGAPTAPEADEFGQVAQALVHLDASLRSQQAERERAHDRALDAERRLARSERLASLGQLAAGLAHELNSPLMVIHGAAEEAKAGAGPGSRRWLERVRRESERCSRLVREMLDFARPSPPHWRRFDLGALLDEAFETARAGRSQPGRWSLARSQGDWRVRGDRDQFLQVLINLLGNGLDSMPEGGRVEAELETAEEQWRLRIRDQGPGVPLRQREAIFRPFYTSKPKGTGLGLAIARNLMLGHQGTLRCAPTRGRGACFEAAWPKQGSRHRA